MPTSEIRALRFVLVAAGLLAGAVVLPSAVKKTEFTKRDKAYYANPNVVAFVRPGLVFKIVSAKIDTSGTISVDFKVSDPKGLGLDRLGIYTPGAVSTSFLAAYIPKGQTQFVSYATRSRAATSGGNVTQAAADSGGTYTQVADGEYVYTFATKAPKDWDPTATHRVAIYGNRNLTEWDLGTSYDDDTLTWVPAGGKPAPRDVIRTESCNRCHGELGFHGGSRRSIETCDICHTPQTTTSSGPTADFKVMIHKIHAGEDLPSVQAGGAYKIGNSDWSTVAFPSDVRRCETCHEPNTGAAQADAWTKNPSRAACGSCHDNVNFATGEGHLSLPQTSDNQCATCHIPEGQIERDASIRGAHTLPQESPSRPGIVVTMVKVENGAAGNKPTLTFTLKDSGGNPIDPRTLVASPGRLNLNLTGPTTDYGMTNFGSDVTTRGYVSESAAATAQCANGTCTYTFSHAVPADAKGTFAIGVEARRGYTILPGTVQQTATQYGADNKVIYFSVDGSTVQPRRQIVDTAKCNGCHTRLSMHGENRNNASEYCSFCHNPANYSGTAPINFSVMAHRIHLGEQAPNPYKIGNSDFSEVRYPTFSPNGRPGDVSQCDMCHVNGSEAVLPIGKNNVRIPGGLVDPLPATTAACTACHQSQTALAHAASQTDAKAGKSCDICHGPNGDFSVLKVHAK
jgi:OmcA/MtrC family decaheme c-type cytochrome